MGYAAGILELTDETESSLCPEICTTEKFYAKFLKLLDSFLFQQVSLVDRNAHVFYLSSETLSFFKKTLFIMKNFQICTKAA